MRRYASMLATFGLAASVAGLSFAQQASPRQVDQSTAGVLSAAIDALEREEYGNARSLIATVERQGLGAVERSRLEQILFSIAYREERYDDAREHLQRAIDAGGLREHEVAQARYQRAQLLMQQERWQEGVEALEQWVAAATQPAASAYYLLAVAYYQTGDFARALPAARAAIDRMEEPQESWLALQAALQVQQEQYQDALPLLNRLTVEMPDKKTYWLQLSSVYAKLGDVGNALATLQVAYNRGLLTESSEVLRLADLLLYNEAPQSAAAVIEESIASGRLTADEAAYVKLGTAWIAAEEFGKAIAPLEQAGELGATGASFLRLGQVHMQLEDWPMAEDAFARAIAKSGFREPGEAELMMGVALFAQARHAEAQAWFEQARAAPRHRDMATRYLERIAMERQPRAML